MSYLRGLDNVVANLNKEIRAIEGRSLAGMLKAAAFIRKRMDEVPPKIPIGPTAGQVAEWKKQGYYREVGTGNLRASWFAHGLRLSIGPAVILGFSANYAAYVHEMIGGNVRWTRPGSGPKFLQAVLRRDQGQILKIIHQEAKIK